MEDRNIVRENEKDGGETKDRDRKDKGGKKELNVTEEILQRRA